jgi:hypothetical protein
MKSLMTPLLTIVTTAVVIGMVTVGIQQHASAFGFVERQQIGEFKKLTHDFEKNVIGDPNVSQGPQPHLRELLDAYANDVTQIFLGGPDTIPGLLEQYQLAVLAVFVQPPEPDKQQKHDQIQEFRQLTKAFEKAVIGAINPPDGD